MRTSYTFVQSKIFWRPLRRQGGSAIFVVLMLLVIMSIIGVASTNTTIMENFIVRNTGIRKQNLHMADAVAMEVYQVLVGNDLPEEDLDPALTNLDWILDKNTWEDSTDYTNWFAPEYAGRLLTTANSEVPQSLLDNIDNGVARILSQRGQWDFGNPDTALSPIRYTFVGWENTEEDSITYSSDPSFQMGRVLVEYLSEDYGAIRLVVGVGRDLNM